MALKARGHSPVFLAKLWHPLVAASPSAQENQSGTETRDFGHYLYFQDFFNVELQIRQRR